MIIDVPAVRLVVNELGFESKHGKQFRGAGACSAVCTVDDYLSANLWRWHARFQPVLVMFPQLVISRQSRNDLWRSFQRASVFDESENLLLDGKLNFVR